jgi:hypothetical protein
VHQDRAGGGEGQFWEHRHPEAVDRRVERVPPDQLILRGAVEAGRRSGVGGLIGSLERWRGGNLVIDGQDFAGSGQGSRFYPLLYLLTRVHGARDFGNGLPLHAQPPGHPATLQVHHIFPREALRAAGYPTSQVNAVANFCFLTRETSLVIAKRKPAEYCGAVAARYPGALASQWIPQDPSLWRIDRYPDFLAARRELLAAAANKFLNRLRSGDAPKSCRSLNRLTVVSGEAGGTDPGADQVPPALVAELAELGCADPAVDCEVSDPATGEVLAIAEACWPEGLRPGQGNPVILVLDPAETDLDRLKELGYETFTSADSLRSHVRRRKKKAAGGAAEPPPRAADAEAPVAAMRM